MATVVSVAIPDGVLVVAEQLPVPGGTVDLLAVVTAGVLATASESVLSLSDDGPHISTVLAEAAAALQRRAQRQSVSDRLKGSASTDLSDGLMVVDLQGSKTPGDAVILAGTGLHVLSNGAPLFGISVVSDNAATVARAEQMCKDVRAGLEPDPRYDGTWDSAEEWVRRLLAGRPSNLICVRATATGAQPPVPFE